MADTFRYRWGDAKPTQCKVQTAQAIAIGDLVGLSSYFAYRSEEEAWVDLSTSQFNFCANFLGVASQRKVSGTAKAGTGGGADNRMRVDTAGVFEFDTFATTFDVGQLVGPAKASGNALESQKVELVTDNVRAIGKVKETKSNASLTKVLVEIFSRVGRVDLT